MDLNDEQTASDLVVHVESGGTFAQFAVIHHVERKTVSRRLAKIPALLERVDAARYRAKNLAHHVERASVRESTAVVVVDHEATPPRAPLPYTREAFLDLVWRHANDPDSKSGPKALGILAEYELGAEVHAARKAAERAGESDGGTQVRRVNVELPRPGGRVVEVEVVES